MVLSGTASLLALCLLAAPVLTDGAAPAPGPPDSAQRARFDEAFSDRALIRVRLDGGSLLLREARALPDGIRGEVADPLPGAITGFGHEERLVSWSEIGRVEKRESHVALGAKLGFTLGLTAGFALAAVLEVYPDGMVYDSHYPYRHWRDHDSTSWRDRALVLVMMPAIGTVLGGLVGSFVPRWRTVLT